MKIPTVVNLFSVTKAGRESQLHAELELNKALLGQLEGNMIRVISELISYIMAFTK